MNSFLRRIIILLVAVIVIVPAAYFTYNVYFKSIGEKNPSSYIPANSTFVARVYYSNATYYFYYGNSSIAAIVPIAGVSFTGLVNSPSLANSTMNLTISLSENYKGVQIFEISNISIITILSDLLDGIIGSNLSAVGQLSFGGLDNLSVYFASPYNTFTVVGTLSAVKWSIDSHTSGQSFTSSEPLYFRAGSNASFYYGVKTASINYVSGNLSSNATHIFLSLNPSNLSYRLSLISALTNNNSFSFRLLSDTLLEITLPVGLQELPLYLKYLSTISNIINVGGA